MCLAREVVKVVDEIELIVSWVDDRGEFVHYLDDLPGRHMQTRAHAFRQPAPQ
jgi:hypothetical protein